MIRLILSIFGLSCTYLISISALSPCYTAIAAEIEQNNVVAVCEKVTAMSEEYNKEYEEKLDSAQAAGLSVDNRLIVETKSKIICIKRNVKSKNNG